MKSRARKLRKNPTTAERHLWYHLRGRRLAGFKFRRQHVIGTYIVDFVCLSRKVIVELDGGQHAARAAYDRRRTRYLTARGYRVLRFWNNEMMRGVDSVLEVILGVLGE